MPTDPMQDWTPFDQQAFLAHLRDVGQHELEGFLGTGMGGFGEWAARWKTERDQAAAAAPKPDPDRACQHTDFAASVEVHPLSDVPGGPATSYYADIRVQCAGEGCEEPFVFIGPNMGLSPRRPMVSFDGQELRAPIRPASTPENWGQQGPGFGLGAVHTEDRPE